MPHHPIISDDPGTVLDSIEEFAKPVPVHGDSAPHPAAVPMSSQAGVLEQPFRSTLCYAVPRIMICDEGSLDEGELIYVRTERLVIGRMKGDIIIPNDTTMSAEHAEVARQDVGGAISWVLRDLGSSNGTFVRCRAVVLQTGMVLQLGSKRYRFENPMAAAVASGNDQPGTTLVDGVASLSTGAWPSLVDCSLGVAAESPRLIIRDVSIRMGRPGFGNQMELDDPCVAAVHATIHRDPLGAWHMRAKPSVNGIWVRTGGVKLTNGCHFQCGEQRFRFQFTK